MKVLQYQAAGLPAIANPVGVHAEMIASGVNGWLPESASEWVDAVKALAVDKELGRRMGRWARESVEARYSVAAREDEFVRAVDGFSRGVLRLRPHAATEGEMRTPMTGAMG